MILGFDNHHSQNPKHRHHIPNANIDLVHSGDWKLGFIAWCL